MNLFILLAFCYQYLLITFVIYFYFSIWQEIYLARLRWRGWRDALEEGCQVNSDGSSRHHPEGNQDSWDCLQTVESYRFFSACLYYWSFGADLHVHKWICTPAYTQKKSYATASGTKLGWENLNSCVDYFKYVHEVSKRLTNHKCFCFLKQ